MVYFVFGFGTNCNLFIVNPIDDDDRRIEESVPKLAIVRFRFDVEVIVACDD